MAVRAVLFDLGDTLIFQAHRPDERRLYDLIGARVGPLLRAWQPDNTLNLAAFLPELFDAVSDAQPLRRARGYEVDAAVIVCGALAEYGVDVTDEQAREFWREGAIDFTAWGWQLYPDTLDTLRRVRASGVPTALVSNSWYTSDLRQTVIGPLGISGELIDVFVFSADLMRPKPRPEPFQRALDALGVAPDEAVLVGDSLDADIRGAKELGMTTVWKLNGRHDVPPAPEADYAIHDLWELFGLDLLPRAAAAALPEESLMPHEDDNADRY